uniref:LSM domain-containing protein n=1 Tax=Trypanosoma congolense (strain IL3000) TaxID=1068625 RepID=G0US98_TRYCI|nr:conserved hypothetical protein [Trypanosoma congolense IL3000]
MTEKAKRVGKKLDKCNKDPANAQEQVQKRRAQVENIREAPDTETNSHPFLGHELRVVLEDKRVIVGTLIAHLGRGDLLLRDALEERRYADGELNHRRLHLVAIPFRYVVAMHRRVPDHSSTEQV